MTSEQEHLPLFKNTVLGGSHHAPEADPPADGLAFGTPNCRTLPSYSVGLQGLCADNLCSVGLPALGDRRAQAQRPAPASTAGCWLRPAEPQGARGPRAGRSRKSSRRTGKRSFSPNQNSTSV